MRKITSLTALVLLTLGLNASIAAAAPPGQHGGGEVYVVQKDDWLSTIAQTYYGDPTTYPRIVEATNIKAAEDTSFASIENPDLILVGQKLWIPSIALTTSPSGALILDVLGNAAYQGIFDGPVQLTDGAYGGEPFVEGGASGPTLVLVDQFTAWGDLNGDGVEDAAVILAENSGGSAVFIYLAAVVDQNGTPVNQATRILGDRVQMSSLGIENGEIVVNMLTHGRDDPFCCPTTEVAFRLRLEGDQLAIQTDFAGTYQAILRTASTPGRDITLTLNPDGTVEQSTDYFNGEAPVVENGTWEGFADGTAIVILTGRSDGLVYDNPTVITFTLEDGELIAIVYDVSLYGSEGLRLTKQ